MAAQQLSFDGLEVQATGRAGRGGGGGGSGPGTEAGVGAAADARARGRAGAGAGGGVRGVKRGKPANASKADKADAAAKRRKFSRGEANPTRAVKDPKLRRRLREQERRIRDAEDKAAREQVLLTGTSGGMEAEDEMERTYRVRQRDIAGAVDERTARSVYDLSLDKLGPYGARYSRNGAHLLLAGRRGHVAVMEWKKQRLVCELQLRETVRDAVFLHSEDMFAVAQRKHVYVYDGRGTELHCLRSHPEPTRLDFLPYHFLLVSVGKAGYLKYQDTSTGALVAEHRTRLGECDVLAHNPHNSVSVLGHGNGSVTMWSPNMSTPLVKMLCHRAPVRAVAVDRGGYHMVTSGLDGQVRVWDVRTYREVHSYYSVRPATSLAVSDSGLLAVGAGPHLRVWRDALASKARDPYMAQQLPGGQVARSVAFCPFEDVMGVGHSGGFSSLVVPGAGEANYDAFEANPFEGRKQRREGTVVRLLEKVQPETITLDPNVVGTVDRASREVVDAERDEAEAKRAAEKAALRTDKKRQKGRNSSLKRWLRKRKNIVDARKVAKKEEIARAARDRRRKAEDEKRKAAGVPRSALDRFQAP